ncbi:MAG: hypothetical protein AAF387_21150 [Pseudomonadota bacterium]
MAITNFGELKTEIQNFVDNSSGNVVAAIPTFVTLATTRLNSELRIRDMEKRSTNTLSSQYIDLPVDFIEARNVQIDSTPRRSLRYRTPEQIDSLVTSGTGIPESYSIYANIMEVYPEPASSYTIEVIYLSALADFVNDSDTNDVLTNYPGLYLWAALIEAETFIDADADVSKWVAQYQNLLQKLNDRDEAGRFSGAQLDSVTLGVCTP